MSTQVHLNPTKLLILSIARDKYWIFASNILRLLHREGEKFGYDKNDQSDDEIESDESSEEESVKTELPTDNSIRQLDPDISSENYFFHIAFTPKECTLVFSSNLAILFDDPLKASKKLQYDDCKLLEQNFLSIQVDSDGTFNNSEKILELTRPLSENKIPLFFFLTHFNDIVLIPDNLKQKVVEILSSHNFEFSDISNSYISVGDKKEELNNNRTMEYETFDTFKRFNISPIVNKNVRLLLTGARSGETSNTISKTMKILSSFDLIPDYFAITRTSLNEISLILPKSSKIRSSLGFTAKNIIGSTQDVIIPITIDFSKLPINSTGIVSGVASKLLYGLWESNDETLLEMSYLSMAQSGIIMIPEENLKIVEDIISVANNED